VLLVLLFVLLLVAQSPSSCHKLSNKLRKSGSCEISFSEYKGPQYFNEASGSVGRPQCLVESKWLKLSQHSVMFPGSDTVFDDWLWIDYHDRINVLVEDKRIPGEEKKFLVFEQSKYALEGRNSLAIIGGVIEPGEKAEDAARREVDEEMNGLRCKDFHFLGRYRTDVNRGMGWLNSFLATDCSRDLKDKSSSFGVAVEDEVGAPDTERQDLKSITLSRLKEAARNGEFLEVQWTATVALALLHPELMQ
jgi:ADP-ribose pyrophosphatase YjhB (NUDIX family)